MSENKPKMSYFNFLKKKGKKKKMKPIDFGS